MRNLYRVHAIETLTGKSIVFPGIVASDYREACELAAPLAADCGLHGYILSGEYVGPAPEPAPVEAPRPACYYCGDTGRNGANGYPCVHCERGIAFLRDRLAHVTPESLTDKLTRMWRELQAIISTTDTPAASAVGYDLCEAAKYLGLAIERCADVETQGNLRRHLSERRATRLTPEADRDTAPLPTVSPIAES